MNDLKQELDMDSHMVEVDVLCQRFETNILTGKTKASAQAGLEKHGFNRLTPPPTTPEWVKFAKLLFGGFSLLLWSGAILCFISYILQASTYEDPPGVNFINILLTNFLYERYFGSFSLVKCT
jgi:sodium/potassium-transporting ATPase subunit alpha